MIDHIIVGAPSLTDASRWLAERTGIEGTYGGQNPHNSTHNMLYQLGGGAYLEILCPDPANLATAERGLPFGLGTIGEPAVVGWAARVEDLGAAVAKADAAGVPHGDVVQMSRMRPDGVVLEWTMTYPLVSGPAALLPVLIDWGGTEHPSTSLAHLDPLRLERFELRTPEHASLGRWFDALGLAEDLSIVPGSPPRYAVTVSGPRGNAHVGLEGDGAHHAGARSPEPAGGT